MHKYSGSTITLHVSTMMPSSSNTIVLPGDCTSRGREILHVEVGESLSGSVVTLNWKPETERHQGGVHGPNNDIQLCPLTLMCDSALNAATLDLF